MPTPVRQGLTLPGCRLEAEPLRRSSVPNKRSPREVGNGPVWILAGIAWPCHP